MSHSTGALPGAARILGARSTRMFTKASPCFGEASHGRSRADGAILSTLESLNVDVTVVLGRNHMPVHMLLRMGRGAVVELESTETDMVEILANGHPIARGQIVVTGNRISVEVTELIRKPSVVREPGVSIGQGSIAMKAAA